MKKIVLLFICLLGGMAIFAQSEKRDGDDMASAGNFSGAAMMYRLCMEQDEECLLKLIRLLYEEKVEPQFTNELFQLLSPLAESGNAEAQLYLGVMHLKGYDTQNLDKSFEWLKKSADQGNSDAQYQLGLMYQKGLGVRQSNDEAIRLFRQSAAQGNELAQSSYEEMVNIAQSQPRGRTQSRSQPAAVTGRPVENVTVTDLPRTKRRSSDNLRLERGNKNRSGLLFAAGGVSIVAGGAASFLLSKPYTEYGDGHRITGKEYNLVYAAAGVVVGGVCIGTGISLKKKSKTFPNSIGYNYNPSITPSARDPHSRLDLVAAGDGIGLRLSF
jgi:hypothetical protein